MHRLLHRHGTGEGVRDAREDRHKSVALHVRHFSSILRHELTQNADVTAKEGLGGLVAEPLHKLS
jgi:hypothetical protein